MIIHEASDNDNDNNNNDPVHQTCCPPGQVYSLDTTWQPPRCGADHEMDNVSDQEGDK